MLSEFYSNQGSIFCIRGSSVNLLKAAAFVIGALASANCNRYKAGRSNLGRLVTVWADSTNHLS
jgi:hypothetical protein